MTLANAFRALPLARFLDGILVVVCCVVVERSILASAKSISELMIEFAKKETQDVHKK